MKIIVDKFDEKVRLPEERLKHIRLREEMHGQKEKIFDTLKKPDCVKVSLHDDAVLIFYKWYDKTPVTSKYMSVVVKYNPDDKFILAAFFADKIKRGETYG